MPTLPYFEFNAPRVSIFDADGKLPLNLQRTELGEDEYPFQDALIEDVFRDFCAFALEFGPDGCPSATTWPWYFKGQYAGIKQLHRYYGDNQLLGWLCDASGFGLLEEWTLSNLKINKLQLVPKYYSVGVIELERPVHGGAIGVAIVNRQDSVEWARFVLQDGGIASSDKYYWRHRHVTGRCMLASNSLAVKLMEPRVIRRETRERLEVHKVHENWAILSTEGYNLDQIGITRYAEAADAAEASGKCGMIGEWQIELSGECQQSRLSDVWHKVFQSSVIPFDRADRASKLAHAYVALSDKIDYHKAEKLDREKKRGSDIE